MPEFIFMLTHGDRTIDDAVKVLAELDGSGLRYVGFKDVGASPTRQLDLTQAAHDLGMEVMLEVVSTSRDDELASLESARAAGVDWVLGGVFPDDGTRILDGSSIRYCPFPGTIAGHPSVLSGSVADIVDHARHLDQMPGVHGVDLLAYRHAGTDPVELTARVAAAIDGPVIAAGSVTSEQQIRALGAAGAWGFTIGSAIFDGQLPGAPSVRGQVTAVLDVAAQANVE